MIQLGIREIGARISDIGSLSKIAEALKGGDVGSLLVFFEFSDSDQLALFCRTIRTMEILGQIEDFEREKLRIKKEIDDLTNEKDKVLVDLVKLREKRAKKP